MKIKFIFFLFFLILIKFNQGDYQIGELVVYFKQLMAKMDYKKISKETPEVVGRKTNIIFPLNEYNPDYLIKSKSDSFIDWDWAFDMLPEEEKLVSEDDRADDSN